MLQFKGFLLIEIPFFPKAKHNQNLYWQLLSVDRPLICSTQYGGLVDLVA